MLLALGAGLVMPFVALYLQRELGASIGQVGVVQATAWVWMTVAALATAIARKAGLAGTIVWTELVPLPFPVLIHLAQSLAPAAALFWLRGMLMNMSMPIYSQLSMVGLPSEDKPFVAGWVRFGWSVSWLAGSSLGGRMMEHSYRTHSYTAALYALGAVAKFLLLRGIEPSESAASVEDSPVSPQGSLEGES